MKETSIYILLGIIMATAFFGYRELDRKIDNLGKDFTYTEIANKNAEATKKNDDAINQIVNYINQKPKAEEIK